MKHPIRLIALIATFPLLSGCLAGTLLGTGANVVGAAVKVGSEVVTTSADVATDAVGAASKKVTGDGGKKQSKTRIAPEIREISQAE